MGLVILGTLKKEKKKEHHQTQKNDERLFPRTPVPSTNTTPKLAYGDKKAYGIKGTVGLIPLLTSSGDGQGGSSFATGQSDDELSTNYRGLDLEALSRLDGRRWSSSCRSQEGLELVAVNRDGEEESMTESIRTLSQKYRPMFFEELIGQNIVVQSLMNAILRGMVASLYLFQGPRGTGKTSTARVLAAALNCLASNKTKPCGVCRECSEFILGNVLRQLPSGAVTRTNTLSALISEHAREQQISESSSLFEGAVRAIVGHDMAASIQDAIMKWPFADSTQFRVAQGHDGAVDVPPTHHGLRQSPWHRLRPREVPVEVWGQVRPEPRRLFVTSAIFFCLCHGLRGHAHQT
ncbi:hypothetical protein RJ639_013888 [Escallonia herrerae]|uniref:Uncharacterized protein n=1 Tax=Escallonia herrerae TaxID=1293975 RepID=A0AA88VGG0_9ASTE|nr:hypothetical protein RJ639_013888 [Escallonia herrerae]